MDTYLILKAFVATVEGGSFSRAGRNLGLAASVITKRVNDLEQQLQVKLFERSTRFLRLTEIGRMHHAEAAHLLAATDAMFGRNRDTKELQDHLRVRAPATMTRRLLSPIILDFLETHSKVRLDVETLHKPVDPLSENFDVAIGAVPVTAARVTDVTLCRLKRILCAAPHYLAQHGMPSHPRELVRHACLNFTPTGPIWTFSTDEAPLSLEILPKLASNDGDLIVEAACRGGGVAITSEYICFELIQSGALVPILTNFALPEIWLKATLPSNRRPSPASTEFVRFLKKRVPEIMRTAL